MELAFGLIEKQGGACGDFTLIDTSCGYGSFLMRDGFRRRIGADVDPVAVKEAQRRVTGVEFHQADALVEVSRAKYGLADDEPVIVIGTPPCNDTTSIIRHGVKDKSFACDADLRHRDIGMPKWKGAPPKNWRANIDSYFKTLLGEHYMNFSRYSACCPPSTALM